MTPLATMCEEKRGDPPTGVDGYPMRCASVAEHLALAVIKLSRACEALEPALTGCLRKIAGVVQVHVDASRSTIQLLYDGEIGTVTEVQRFLVATGWGTGNRSVAGGQRRKTRAIGGRWSFDGIGTRETGDRNQEKYHGEAE